MGLARKIVASAALALGGVGFWAPPAFAAAFRDDFAGRETLTGLPVEVSGSNLGATAEAGDPPAKPFSPGPTFHPAGHSVWVEWEATQTEYVTVSVCGSGIPLVLGVYQSIEPVELGHWSELRAGQIGGKAGCAPVEAGFNFRAIAGLVYEFFLDGDDDPFSSGPKEGALAMRIEATPRPPNDDFAAATVLSGRFESEHPGQYTHSVWQSGYTWAATKEIGEPAHGADAAGGSVWYQWTAPESGNATISLGERYSARFAVYRGESLGSLEQVSTGHEYGVLPVTGGASYRIAVDETMGESGPEMSTFLLSLWMYRTTVAPGGSSGDRHPPHTAIVSRKVKPRKRSAVFRFRSDEAETRFLCRLDRGKPRRCSSPKAYVGLAKGRHTFSVFAIDAAGNADATPATAQFEIGARKTRHSRAAAH